MAKQGKVGAVPRLRFPEFRNTGAWPTHLLEALERRGWIELGRGNIISNKDIKATPGDFPIYSSSVKNNGYMGSYGQHMFDEELISWSIDGGGDFFYRPKHKFSVTNVSGYMHLDPAHLNYRFTAYELQRLHSTYVFDYQLKAHPSVIRKLYRLALPAPAEQQKIADCLTSLDEVIAAHGRKVEALKAHKRGLMQQLFPRAGETRPRLRFPEFRNAPQWAQIALGKVAEIKLGKMLDANKHKSGRQLPYINNISLRWNEVDTSDLPQMYFDEKELERYGLRKNDVLVCEGGEPGRSAVWDGVLPDVKFQKAVHRVRFHVPFVPKLLVLYLEAISGTNAFESLFTGGGIKHLTGETFAKLAIPLMPLAEQHRIASCLSSLDAQITAETAQLAALKTHKCGLMQQLFPQPEAAA